MKSKLLFIGIILFCTTKVSAQMSSHLPRLVKNGNYVQLLVGNKPYLVLGGELDNSSASSNDYMRPIWRKLKQMNLNTVIAPVYWELIEPAEGLFDFSSADTINLNEKNILNSCITCFLLDAGPYAINKRNHTWHAGAGRYLYNCCRAGVSALY